MVSVAFILRSYEDGPEGGYRDVFPVVVVESEEGQLLIDYAHRDVILDDGTMVAARVICLHGVLP